MFPRPTQQLSRLLVFGLLAAGLTVLGGCGPDYKARGVVKGKVTFNKQPLPAGTVIFYGPHNIVTSTTIDENGNYVMNDAPVGEVKVAVKVDVPPPTGGSVKARWEKIAGKMESKDPTGENPGIAIMGKMPSRIVRIPDTFADPETSGIKTTVEKGENTFNIEF